MWKFKNDSFICVVKFEKGGRYYIAFYGYFTNNFFNIIGDDNNNIIKDADNNCNDSSENKDGNNKENYI